MIESVNNELIKRYAKLKDKKYRDKENLFIVEGKHLVEEALKADLIVDIFSLDGKMGTKVSLKVMQKLSSLDTVSNVLGIAHKKKEREILGNILILDDLQNPGNLGTIIRSAVAFGVDTIVASPKTVDLYNPKVVRATEGMLFKINYIVTDIEEFLKNLEHYEIYVTDVRGGIYVSKINKRSKYALIMGNEGAGANERYLKYASKKVYIPMEKDCESLNVAIATSIILYELNKR